MWERMAPPPRFEYSLSALEKRPGWNPWLLALLPVWPLVVVFVIVRVGLEARGSRTPPGWC